MTKSCCPTLENLLKPEIQVKYLDLTRLDEVEYLFLCPLCEIGCLTPTRSILTLKINDHVTCPNCGQHFIFSDIEELRSVIGGLDEVQNVGSSISVEK